VLPSADSAATPCRIAVTAKKNFDKIIVVPFFGQRISPSAVLEITPVVQYLTLWRSQNSDLRR